MSLQGWVVAAADDATAHQLDLLAEQVRRDYFAELPSLPIRWGHSISRRKRTSIRLGSYDHRTGEIRIHPSLNAQWVPRFFVESVIHHEYLHHVLGPDHDRRFRAFERRFRFHRESQLWLKRHLPVLLGRRERPTPPPRPVPVASPGQQLALF